MEGDSQFSLLDIFRGIEKATSGLKENPEEEKEGQA